MNTFEDVLAEAGRVDYLAPTSLERGRAELDDAVRSLDAGPSAARLRPDHRRRSFGFGVVSAAGLAAAAAAAAAAVVLGSTHTHSSKGSDLTNEAPGGDPVGSGGPTVPQGSGLPAHSIELAGYRITLPASYKVGKSAVADAKCTADLNLNADEAERLITTPTPGCPLVIGSVQRTLPDDASKFTITQGDHAGVVVAAFIGYQDRNAGKTYLPVELPDRTTVYVTLRGSTVSASHADVGLGGGYYTVQQLQQFEQGVRVTPTSQLPSRPLTSPEDKPTVNCDVNCGD